MTTRPATRSSIDDYIASLVAPLHGIATRTAAIITAALPAANAAVWHGHPVWSMGDRPGRSPVCLLKAYPAYVTLAFWNGSSIVDASNRLRASGRAMAHVKLRAEDDIDAALFTDWLHQASALAAPSDV